MQAVMNGWTLLVAKIGHTAALILLVGAALYLAAVVWWVQEFARGLRAWWSRTR